MNSSQTLTQQSDQSTVQPDTLRSTKLWVQQEMLNRHNSFYEKYGKRAFDICVATAAGIAVAPIVATAALAVKIETPGPVIFTQQRLGRGVSTFNIYKLRTMRHGNRSTGEVLPGNPDTTRVGRVLRRLKIDELPQIYNVLRGEMSIVGPRPFLEDSIEDLTEDGIHRFLIKPGLTGHAQTNGNITLSWPVRWRYDRAYVDNVSFLFDAKILLKTLSVILFGEKPTEQE